MSKSHHDKKKLTLQDIEKGYRPVIHRTVELKESITWLSQRITKIHILYAWSYSEELWRADKVTGFTEDNKKVSMSTYRESDGLNVRLKQSALSLHKGAIDTTNTLSISTNCMPDNKPTSKSDVGVGDVIRRIIENNREQSTVKEEDIRIEKVKLKGQFAPVVSRKYAHAQKEAIVKRNISNIAVRK